VETFVIYPGEKQYFHERGKAKPRFGLSTRLEILTLLRVGLPTVIASVLGFMYFDAIAVFLCKNWRFAFNTALAEFLPNVLQVSCILTVLQVLTVLQAVMVRGASSMCNCWHTLSQLSCTCTVFGFRLLLRVEGSGIRGRVFRSGF
jgi:hypothetical protein